MTGWISLHRSIENHWLYEEKRVFSKFEAWVHLLFIANHSDGKVPIGNQLIDVKRGQKLTSIKKLSTQFNWSRTKTDSFLQMLKNDGMLDIKKTSKYTLITIVNYDFYQSDEGRKKHQKDINSTSIQHQKDINSTSIQHQKDTNNNGNNVNNDINKELNNKLNNEAAEDRKNGVKDIISFYESNGYGAAIPPSAVEQIDDWLNYGFDSGSIIEAFKIGVNNNSRTLKFVNGVINTWKRADVKKYDEVMEYEKNWSYNQSSKNKKDDYKLSPEQQAQIDKLGF